MKRFIKLTLALCIALMCVCPFEAQGQHRRGASSSSQSAAQQSTRNNSSSTATKSSGQRQNNSSVRKSHSGEQTQTRVTPPANNRTQRVNPPANNSRNGNGNITINNNQKRNGSRVNPPARPEAIRYRPNSPRRDPHWERPYLEPRHRPAPAHIAGSHNFGYRLNTLPRGYARVVYRGRTYFVLDGIYYRKYLLGGYVVCRPPMGIVISSNALNVALTIATINQYRNALDRAREAAVIASVYAAGNSGYKVRQSSDYVTNVSSQSNEEYYYEDGVFYTIRNGQYVVIEAPIGALVTQLPEDFEEITLNGETYYQVEDVLYRITIIDGTLYFEVVCNL